MTDLSLQFLHMNLTPTIIEISKYNLKFLKSLEISNENAQIINTLALLIGTLGIALLANYIIRETLTRICVRLTKRKFGLLFDALVTNKVIDRTAHLIPIIICANTTFVIVSKIPGALKLADSIITVLLTFLILVIFKRFLRSLTDVAETIPGLMDKPLESYYQVSNIILFFIGGTLIYSEITGKEIWALFVSLGAMSAILLLVFKDSIMGFVASIQVTTNDMVRIGDWIEMPKYGADGDVIEISLNTVKVQNFDKTISTMPTYALISESFKNWRGMRDTGSRRIKRSINIKMNSIKFLDENDLQKLYEITLLKPYLEDKKLHIEQYNQGIGANKSILINGRNLTNLGVFRQYINAYLKNNSNLNHNMTQMVRQLAPINNGIPLEIYAFAKTIIWIEYEEIMADIFDHVIASAPYFDLEIFEEPSGSDFRRLSSNIIE
jgi:miniconductance mechanosensitive channel